MAVCTISSIDIKYLLCHRSIAHIVQNLFARFASSTAPAAWQLSEITLDAVVCHPRSRLFEIFIELRADTRQAIVHGNSLERSQFIYYAVVPAEINGQLLTASDRSSEPISIDLEQSHDEYSYSNCGIVFDCI